jgi:hypothetical protein
MDADAGFASQMRRLVPGVDSLRGPLGGISYKPPLDWTWNHALDQPGVTQLVPSAQHNSSSPYWWLMHQRPSGIGGFAQWGHAY